jgi:hypothetical protein
MLGLDALIMGHHAPIRAQCKLDRPGSLPFRDAARRDRPPKTLYNDPARATHISAGRRFVPVRTFSTALMGYRDFGATAGRLGADRGRQENHGRNAARRS